jgi:L,D-transpeptidase catalytic domain
MKWIILFSFILNNALFINMAFAQEQNQNPDQERAKAEELYRSFSNTPLSSVVPLEAFIKGMAGVEKYKSSLNKKTIITFINFAIPNNQPRLAFVNFGDQKQVLVTSVDHGINSSEENGRACEKNRMGQLLDGGKTVPLCQKIQNSKAIEFNGPGGSGTSILGFSKAGEGTSTSRHEQAILVHGLESGNSNAASRSILFHDSGYAGTGWGFSAGCFSMTKDDFATLYPSLKGGTLVYSFRSDDVTPATQEEIKKAIAVPEDGELVSAPETPPQQSPKPDFEETELAKAEPSKDAKGMGIGGITAIAGVGTAVVMGSKSSKVGDNNAVAASNLAASQENLQGSAKYEKCQGLSDTSWANTTEYINSGGNPSDRFRGSWAELNATVKRDSVENADAVDMAEERVATINDCVATAYISNRTDFTKPNINQPDKKTSSDGSITCVYEGPESQDYQACLKTIAEYEKLRKDEKSAHNQQAADYQASSQKRLNQVGGESAQAEALKQFSGLQADHSNIALERAEIANNNINSLASVAARIPTTDSLYDECKAKFAKHGTVSINEYNQFSKIYMIRPKAFSAERDYCLQAVTNGTKPLHNQEAREQIKQVLKKFGHEMEEYTSKSAALKNRTALTPSMDSGTFTRNLTDINFNSGGAGSPMAGFGSRDGSILLQGGAKGGGYGADGSTGTGLTGSGSNGAANAVGGSRGIAGSYDYGSGEGATGLSSYKNDSSSSSGSGIYDQDFHNKINMALKNPEKLGELGLNQEQMKEYQAIKSYKDSLARSPTGGPGASGPEEWNGRKPTSSAGDVKDERPVDIAAKEMNIFEIISTRYAKKYFEGL